MNTPDSTTYINENQLPEKKTEGVVHPPKADTAKNVAYPFVNLIRFIATIGIVFLHSGIPLAGNDFNAVLHKVNHVEYYFLLRQIFKFSTICYFMIAGFLLADKVTHANPFQYYKRRLDVIVKPYILSFSIFIALLLIRDYWLTNTKFQWYDILTSIKFSLLYTAFWYIPNYLICLLTIVGFARYIQSPYFGGLLFLVTLGYTYFDVYSPLHTNSHTTALLGFVFYMWLGIYIKKNNLIRQIKRINPWLMGVILVAVFLISNFESYYLFNYTHTKDSFNTLRISNQLYSVVVFMFLVRCCGKAPKFGIFNPRAETYGIYLYHSILTFFVLPSFENWLGVHFHISLFSYNVFNIMLLTVVNCAISYFATTALVKLLLRYKLAFLPEL